MYAPQWLLASQFFKLFPSPPQKEIGFSAANKIDISGGGDLLVVTALKFQVQIIEIAWVFAALICHSDLDAGEQQAIPPD